MSHKTNIFKIKQTNPSWGYDRIAKTLGIHKNTVRFHLAQAYKQKLFNAGYIAKCETLTKQDAVNLLGGKCKICGYDKCLDALEFHHRDAKTKDVSISRLLAIKKIKEQIIQEISKCDLLCANCHREIHAKTKLA